MRLDLIRHPYSARMGSDVVRDGMFLELTEHGAALAEVFRSDVDGVMTFKVFREDVPIELIEALIAEAKMRLRPER